MFQVAFKSGRELAAHVKQKSILYLKRKNALDRYIVYLELLHHMLSSEQLKCTQI